MMCIPNLIKSGSGIRTLNGGGGEFTDKHTAWEWHKSSFIFSKESRRRRRQQIISTRKNYYEKYRNDKIVTFSGKLSCCCSIFILYFACSSCSENTSKHRQSFAPLSELPGCAALAAGSQKKAAMSLPPPFLSYSFIYHQVKSCDDARALKRP
jgi:hypothetical protein